ncbi:MAG: oxidoreductase [Firmicutes bacterium]|jgi:short-subunit dehydrogenase|nr:oxidoreductase [Bacillota bacterium]
MREKVVLVTGASSGIGFETCKQLISRGFVVYGAARRLERMKVIEKMGARILYLDVTNDKSIVDCINKIIDEEGRIDVLINNAGYGIFGSLEDVSLEEARRQMEVNVFGLARITQIIIPNMRKLKSGRIINITSIGGKITTPFGGWYQASKYALESLSDSMRMDLKSFGIDVAIIEPGGVKTEWSDIMLDNFINTTSEIYIDAAKKVANGTRKSYESEKMSKPSDIAKTVVRAVTDKKVKTRYVCGHQAKMALFMRRILSDKLFDKVVSNMTS